MAIPNSKINPAYSNMVITNQIEKEKIRKSKYWESRITWIRLITRPEMKKRTPNGTITAAAAIAIDKYSQKATPQEK